MISTDVQTALGLLPVQQRVRVIMRGAAGSRGQVVQFDLARGNAATTSALVAESTSSLVNVAAPTAAGIKYGLCAVLESDVAQNGKAWAIVRGRVYALCKKTSGSITYGDPLQMEASGTALQATLAANARVVAISLGTATTPTTATLRSRSCRTRRGL